MRALRWAASRANALAILAGLAIVVVAAFQVEPVLGVAVLGGSLIIAGLDGVRR